MVAHSPRLPGVVKSLIRCTMTPVWSRSWPIRRRIASLVVSVARASKTEAKTGFSWVTEPKFSIRASRTLNLPLAACPVRFAYSSLMAVPAATLKGW